MAVEPALGDQQAVGVDPAGEAFAHVETVEFIVAPWEWRQWFLEAGEMDNRPLFQTVDIPAVNAPGPLRDGFLAWVAEEVDALAEALIKVREIFA